MPSDMRDELVTYGGAAAYGGRRFDKDSPAQWERVAERVIDSIPPGSFKLDEKTWVRREVVSAATVAELAEHWEDCPLPPDADCDPCHRYAGVLRLVPVYTEGDHAE